MPAIFISPGTSYSPEPKKWYVGGLYTVSPPSGRHDGHKVKIERIDSEHSDGTCVVDYSCTECTERGASVHTDFLTPIGDDQNGLPEKEKEKYLSPFSNRWV
jgi:hypothetical protein